MLQNLDSLQQQIAYSFENNDLLKRALTHSSVGADLADNQRLEFLGDSVLGLVIADSLFKTHPEAPEGILDHMRASIVNGNSLAKLARKLQLDAVLNVSEAQQRHLPAPSNSMLEDALEALLGAIYLDGGLPAARETIETLFAEALDQASDNSSSANPKGRLQEWTQKHHEGTTPIYKELERTGPDHDRNYIVEVEIAGKCLGQGSGSSLKQAERKAAQAAIDSLAS